MSRDEILQRFPKASAAFIRANETRPALPSAVAEPPVCHGPLAAHGGEKESPGRIKVRITSHRRRLLDFDNFAGGCKYVCDAIKYAGLIPDDNPAAIDLSFAQVKVGTVAEERTEIEIG